MQGDRWAAYRCAVIAMAANPEQHRTSSPCIWMPLVPLLAKKLVECVGGGKRKTRPEAHRREAGRVYYGQLHCRTVLDANQAV